MKIAVSGAATQKPNASLPIKKNWSYFAVQFWQLLTWNNHENTIAN